MTAREIINSAMGLLGYSDGDARLQASSLASINAVYSDLFYLKNKEGYQPISNTEQVINLDERTINNVMVYGVASYLAQSLGDTDTQNFFSIIYNQRRKAVVNPASIQDVLPVAEE